MTNNYLRMPTYLLLKKDPKELDKKRLTFLVEALQGRLKEMINLNG